MTANSNPDDRRSPIDARDSVSVSSTAADGSPSATGDIAAELDDQTDEIEEINAAVDDLVAD